MKKPKKITIKPFINVQLEPIAVENNDAGLYKEELHYPLYYLVTYNRKNTKVKSNAGAYYLNIDNIPSEIVKAEGETIEKIVRYLILKFGDNIDLKGLGNLFKLLGSDLVLHIEVYLKEVLRLAAENIDPDLVHILNFYDTHNPFSKYYEVMQLIFKDFSNHIYDSYKIKIEAYFDYTDMLKKEGKESPAHNRPSIIDWLNSNHRNEVLDLLKNNTKLKDIIQLIDQQVNGLTQYILR